MNWVNVWKALHTKVGYAGIFVCSVVYISSPGMLISQGALAVDDGSLTPSQVNKQNNLKKPGLNIKLDIKDSSLSFVVRTIGKQSGRQIVFNDALPEFRKKVRMSLNESDVWEALNKSLKGTELQAKLASDGTTIVISPSPRIKGDTVKSNEEVSLRGVIVDSANGAVLAGAAVTVSGKNIKDVTNSKGEFTLRGLSAGEYTLSIKLFGYSPVTRVVKIVPDKVVSLRLVLTAMSTSLSEVVTTAAGQRRRVEVPNDIVKINVEEVAARSPVRSVADILEASQIPGVQVQRGGGDPGSATKVRIRGVKSISQSNDPVVIVDGIWVDGSTGSPSKLDDIDPTSIESIEIVRGPSAATLYGQDASNGVIVITTKRGRPGPTRWNASYKRDWGQVYGKQPLSYAGIGYHPVSRDRISCTVQAVIRYECIQEAVSVYDPNDPMYGAEGSGTNDKYSLQLDGGSNSVTYSITGSLENEIGVRRSSPLEKARFRRVGYAVYDHFILPSQLSRRNLTTNLNLRTSEKMTIDLTGMTSQSRLTDNSISANWGVISNGIPTTTQSDYYNPDSLLNPNAQHNISASERPVRTSKYTVGAVTKYGPFNYSVADGTVVTAILGAEVASTERSQYLAETQCGKMAACFDTLGQRKEESIHEEMFTARLRASTNLNTGHLSRFIAIIPSIGADLLKKNRRTVSVGKLKVPPGDRSIDAGELSLGDTRHILFENATAGWYINATIGLLQRVYFDVGIRQDIGSAITSSSNSRYPKIGGSWLVSDESFWKDNAWISLLRLRSAVGYSAVQPDLVDIYGRYKAGRTIVDGKLVRSVSLDATGNNTLRPERSAEFEVGFDMDMFHDRLNIVTTYAKSTNKNVLISSQLPSSFGSIANIKENIAKVTNRNVEISATSRIVENRNALVVLNYSLTLLENRVKELGTSLIAANNYLVEGYPLTGIWSKKVMGFRDDNGDGMLSVNEVVLSDQNVYIGSSQPRYSAGYGGSVTLFGKVVLDSRFAYQSQYVQVLSSTNYRYGSVDISAPLEDQANEIRISSGKPVKAISDLRWNSASIQYHLPNKWLDFVKARSVSVSLQGNNLMLWSNYVGRDPGVNSEILQSEGRGDSGSVLPSPRLYVLDFKIGF